LKKAFYILVFAFILVALGCLSACRKDFDFQPSSGQLEFSKDTVFLDTVFANIGSSTYTLKVYNTENEDIVIPNIELQNGQNSGYRLNVDGLAGKSFTDIPILAKDSLFIFVEVTQDITNTNTSEFLYTDEITFTGTSTTQSVTLVSLIRDAVFLFPQEFGNGMTESLLLGNDSDGNEIRIEGFILDDEELNFNNEKPYVIYGYAAVPADKNLVIDAGSRVHFHKNSGLLIGNNGRLNINGAISLDSVLMENEVVFEGDRLEPEFASVPGQWGSIWISPGSRDNSINHLTIKNATIGILIEGNGQPEVSNLQLSNSQIYNSSATNLWGINASINAQNSVFGSAGSASVYCNLGGAYNFTHCTIANYWINGFRNSAALQIDNFLATTTGQEISADLRMAAFNNCIIDGNRPIELSLQANDQNAFNFQFTHCSFKFDPSGFDFAANPLLDFNNSPDYDTFFLNPNTEFVNPILHNFSLGESSEILNLGESSASELVPLDILGNQRDIPAELGAYEFIMQ